VQEQAKQKPIPIHNKPENGWLIFSGGSDKMPQSDIKRPLSRAPSPTLPATTAIQATITQHSGTSLHHLKLDAHLIRTHATRLVGGHLIFFKQNWEGISQNAWILQTVQSVRLEFTSLPPTSQIYQPLLNVEKPKF